MENPRLGHCFTMLVTNTPNDMVLQVKSVFEKIHPLRIDMIIFLGGILHLFAFYCYNPKLHP